MAEARRVTDNNQQPNKWSEECERAEPTIRKDSTGAAAIDDAYQGIDVLAPIALPSLPRPRIKLRGSPTSSEMVLCVLSIYIYILLFFMALLHGYLLLPTPQKLWKLTGINYCGINSTPSWSERLINIRQTIPQ